jgi:nitrate reductase NapE
MAKQSLSVDEKIGKRNELKALSLIVFILFPTLSIAGVGSYGFVLWMFQVFGGVVAH